MKNTVTPTGVFFQAVTDLKSALLPGTVAGIMLLVMSVSFAALIFSGPLAPFLQSGVSMAVSSVLIAGLIMITFCGCQPLIVMTDEDTAPVLALLAAGVYATLGAEQDPAVIFQAIALSLICATLITGLCLTLVGYLGIGELIQYLPHSVMGGYFCSLGWLLVIGALGLSVPTDITSTCCAPWFSTQVIAGWLPAVALAAWLFLMRNRISRALLLPLSAVSVTLLWYAASLWIGITPQQALEAGYLIGPFSQEGGGIFATVNVLDLSNMAWPTLLTNLGSIASILLISALSLLLSLNGIAALQNADADMNRELIVAGVANIASGAGGGMIGMPSYSLSSMAIESGAKPNRWTGLIALVVCLLFYVYGLPLLAYIPRTVVAGLLLFVGTSLIDEWLVKGWNKFPPLEYMVIPVILAVSVIFDFLQGILVGLICAVVLFVVKYSQTSAIRFFGTGAEFMSNVDRDDRQQGFLRKNGKKILIVSLDGYLFFGSARSIYQRILDYLEPYEPDELTFLILDFSRVSGMDASAEMSFRKLGYAVKRGDAKMLLCGVSRKIQERFDRLASEDSLSESSAGLFVDLDHCVEWCEETLLKAAPDLHQGTSCFEQMGTFVSPIGISTLISYLQRREVSEGEVLTSQGEQATELFFLESCAASAFITTSTGEAHRVRRSGRGTVFGEMGFYLNAPRTASVVMDEAGVIYVLTQLELARMEEQAPDVAASLNRYMARLLSERLMFTTKTLRAISA